MGSAPVRPLTVPMLAKSKKIDDKRDRKHKRDKKERKHKQSKKSEKRHKKHRKDKKRDRESSDGGSEEHDKVDLPKEQPEEAKEEVNVDR